MHDFQQRRAAPCRNVSESTDLLCRMRCPEIPLLPINSEDAPPVLGPVQNDAEQASEHANNSHPVATDRGDSERQRGSDRRQSETEQAEAHSGVIV